MEEGETLDLAQGNRSKASLTKKLFELSWQSIREFLALPRPLVGFALFSITVIFAVPVFNQGDLNHTVVSSYAYLKGHFLDFYDFNQPKMWGNDYLPILYLIFAVWMAPYFYSGLPIASESIGSFALSPGEIVVISAGEIIWAKLLLVLFFFASAIILFRIAKIIHPNSSGRQSVAVWSYVLSPFALFSFGVFSQYDIIGVVFTLAAVYMFLQKRLFGFAVLIGFALTFKFFAALLVAPLLLLANKKFLQIVIYGMISAFPVVIQFAMYWSNDAFRGRIFTQLTSKAGGASTSWEAYAAVAAYFGILVAAYFSNKWPGSFEKKTVLFILSSYGMLLSVVVWHPQWVIILTPFIALAVSFLSRPGLWMLWEAVAFVAYVGYVVTFFKGNVDGVMIQRGALSSLFSEPTFFVADFYPLVLGSTLLLVTELFFISAALALLINIFHLPKGKFQLPGFSYSVRILMLWAAFIVPAFLAIYLPAETVIWS